MAITFVDAATPASVNNGGTPTIDLTTISGLAQNDIVIVLCGTTAGTVATPSGGWTSIHSITTMNTGTGQGACFYKIMGASPDTSVTFWDSGGSGDSGAAIAFAFRGVDTSTPMDTTPTENDAGSGSSPDAPAITPANDNTCIVALGMGMILDTSIGTITNYTHPTDHTGTGNDNNDVTVAGAYRILTGGAGVEQNPVAWNTWSNATWWAVTIALRPSAATAHDGAATFAGAGSLSVLARLNMIIAATMQGAGALSVTARMNQAAFATFMGAGTLSAKVEKFIDAQFNGAGDLRCYVSSNMIIQATLGGTGNLLVEGTIPGGAQSGEARFEGAGSLSALARQNMIIQATFNGAGSLSAYTVQRMIERATFQGSGSMSIYASSNMRISALFNGAGNLSADAFKDIRVEARFAGAGSLSALTLQGHRALATFQGAGSLSAAALQNMIIRATFAGAGSLSALGFKGPGLEARFNGAGGMSIRGLLRMQAQAQFDGAGNFSIAVRARYAANVRFTGSGDMLITVRQDNRAAARFEGAGSLQAAWLDQGAVAHDGQARFNGAGGMSVAWGVAHVAEVRYLGEGGMRIEIVFGERQVQPYTYPIGRSLDSDYGIRGSKLGRNRLIIGRR